MDTLTKETLRDNAIENFRFARKQLGLTSKEFGEMVGLPQKTIGAIEEGRAIAEHSVYLLSRLINVSIDTLYTTRLNAGNNNHR